MFFVRILMIIFLFIAYGCDNNNENVHSVTAAYISKAADKKVIEAKDIALKQDKRGEAMPGSPSDAFVPFYIYKDKGSRDNHFTPSGFMGDWQCVDFNDRFQENCQSGETCIKIVYDVPCSREGQRWAGIYWLNPPNNWGKRKGGFNLTGAEKLFFWAKGENGG